MAGIGALLLTLTFFVQIVAWQYARGVVRSAALEAATIAPTTAFSATNAEEAETTGTFKYRKVELVKEGFDPSNVSEPIWYFDPDTNKYEPLTPDAYETIASGAVKF